MKTILGVVALLPLIACPPALANADTSVSSSPSNDALRERYQETLEKSARDQEETHKKNQEMLEKVAREQDETHKKNIELLQRIEELAIRQEQDAARYERILSVWEKQQAQYQQYLDALPKR